MSNRRLGRLNDAGEWRWPLGHGIAAHSPRFINWCACWGGTTGIRTPYNTPTVAPPRQSIAVAACPGATERLLKFRVRLVQRYPCLRREDPRCAVAPKSSVPLFGRGARAGDAAEEQNLGRGIGEIWGHGVSNCNLPTACRWRSLNKRRTGADELQNRQSRVRIQPDLGLRTLLSGKHWQLLIGRPRRSVPAARSQGRGSGQCFCSQEPNGTWQAGTALDGHGSLHGAIKTTFSSSTTPRAALQAPFFHLLFSLLSFSYLTLHTPHPPSLGLRCRVLHLPLPPRPAFSLPIILLDTNSFGYNFGTRSPSTRLAQLPGPLVPTRASCARRQSSSLPLLDPHVRIPSLDYR